MAPKQGLLLLDEKVLTAKRLAFRTLLRLGFRLFAADDLAEVKGLRESSLQEIAKISNLQQAKEPSVSLAQFLHFLPEYFAKALSDVFPPEKQEVLNHFRTHLALEAKQCISIVDDCNLWLSRLRTLGGDYIHSNVDIQIPVPPTPLRFDVLDTLMLHAIGGATTQPNDEERVIELSFNPDDFSFPSYYSTLCVLSHEFWCHALSRLRVHPQIPATPPQEVWGCNPGDLWEEGWIDFVQSLILQWELHKIVSDPLNLPGFVENCPTYATSRNDSGRGQARAFGYRTALHFYKFLQQRFRQANHFACLVRLSLELNTIDCAPDIKQDFVYAMSGCFDLDPIFTGTAQSIDQYQRALADQQAQIFEILRDSGADTSKIDLILLLKLLKIIV